jgi:4-hydroxybenzoate polyprenyltransferase
MAWAAARNSLAVPAWLLYGSTFCWAVAYDTIYALQDREDDLRIGLKSAAILFGSRTWIAVGIAFGAMLTLLVIAGWLTGLGLIYYGVLAVVGGFFARQTVTLRGSITPPEAFALFKQHVWVGWAVLTGMWLGFL